MPVMPIGNFIPALAQAMEPSEKISGLSPIEKGKFDTLLKSVMEGTSDSMSLPKIDSAQTRVQSPGSNSMVQNFVGSIANSENRLNELVALGLSGQKFSQQQLLTMQAGVYRATLAIDVVSKGVEQTTSGLKTLLQSQV